jgi:23S rRNA (cytosine1962-C5)-methyltransferase
MHLDRMEVVNALKHVFGKKIKAIYDKSKETLPPEYGQNCNNDYLEGKADTPYEIVENGIKFSVNWVTGQKTGFFIDQRDNRQLLSQHSKGKSILNTFCYSGGFSMYALKRRC